ncbi:type II toxin-antitoxin system prevent-host-death family antitoxin [bacterium]|nr:type II toxin-antitoxin system prevent-host-death family antitoxin [bacterium]MBU1599661.1 type II toxin-antitoxin system prevent-host-death family antitoxin [bacterium]MBU2461422.1 type II toxin-antitoxin system prevent-host-death family antitoxin [bacterium]
MYSNVISITEAKKGLLGLAREVMELGKVFTLTKHGKPAVVLMDAKEYESVMETLDILSDSEEVKGIKDGKRDIKAGRWTNLEEIIVRLQG